MITERSDVGISGLSISSNLMTLSLIKTVSLGTLPTFFFWESLIYVTRLNKWELILYLLWRSIFNSYEVPAFWHLKRAKAGTTNCGLGQ